MWLTWKYFFQLSDWHALKFNTFQSSGSYVDVHSNLFHLQPWSLSRMITTIVQISVWNILGFSKAVILKQVVGVWWIVCGSTALNASSKSRVKTWGSPHNLVGPNCLWFWVWIQKGSNQPHCHANIGPTIEGVIPPKCIWLASRPYHPF